MSRGVGWRRWAHLVVIRGTTLVRIMTGGAVDVLGSWQGKARTSSHSTLFTRLLLDPNSLVANVPLALDEIASLCWRVAVRSSIALPLHIIPITTRSRRRT